MKRMALSVPCPAAMDEGLRLGAGGVKARAPGFPCEVARGVFRQSGGPGRL